MPEKPCSLHSPESPSNQRTQQAGSYSSCSLYGACERHQANHLKTTGQRPTTRSTGSVPEIGRIFKWSSTSTSARTRHSESPQPLKTLHCQTIQPQLPQPQFHTSTPLPEPCDLPRKTNCPEQPKHLPHSTQPHPPLPQPLPSKSSIHRHQFPSPTGSRPSPLPSP